jgi:hypothetical protein
MSFDHRRLAIVVCATMKTALLTAAIGFLSLSSSFADWVIVQKAGAAGQNQEVTMKIKDNLTRMDVGGQMTMIMDTTSGSMEMFMHAQKMVMRMDKSMMESAMAMAGQLGGNTGDAKPAAPKATGEKVKVGEWDTEVFTWSGGMGEGKFYVAKDFPGYAKLAKIMDEMTKAMGNPATAMAPQSSDFPGMVVKSEMKVKGQTVTSELVSAKEEAVDAKEFKAPDGYNEMKMPNIPGLTPPAK